MGLLKRIIGKKFENTRIAGKKEYLSRPSTVCVKLLPRDSLLSETKPSSI